MSFLGVKVILFLVIPLIIKEKSNASALDRYEHVERSIRDNFLKAFARFFALYLKNNGWVLDDDRLGFRLLLSWFLGGYNADFWLASVDNNTKHLFLYLLSIYDTASIWPNSHSVGTRARWRCGG